VSEPKRRGGKFRKSSSITMEYLSGLRGIAREVGRIASTYDPHLSDSAARIRATLRHYSEILLPWAQVNARKVALALNHQDRKTWAKAAKEMSVALKEELDTAPVGTELQRFLSDNVQLITSLPLDAADRVHALTMRGLTSGERQEFIKEEILRTGEVTKSRAETIARTETSRTANALVQIRSQEIGVTHYVWRTAKDADVRPSHKRMEGRVVAFDKPPTLDGMTGHAGMFPNCRCYIEPIVPDLD